MSGTVYDDSDPLPDVTYDLVPTGEHAAALAEVERLRSDRDRWVRAYHALDGAIKNHREAYDVAGLFVEAPDAILWKRRDKATADLSARDEKRTRP
jgi:hypothetical protein